MLQRNTKDTAIGAVEELQHTESGSLKEVLGGTALVIGALCVYAGTRYETFDLVAALAALTRDTM